MGSECGEKVLDSKDASMIQKFSKSLDDTEVLVSRDGDTKNENETK
jgi:hypothetical protein